MATGTIPAGRGFSNPHPRGKFCARARHPSRARNCARARHPRAHPCPPAARQQASAPWGCKHIEALPLERNEIEALGCVGATGRRRSERGNASCKSACRIEIPALGERQRPADNQRDAGERRTVERTTCRRRCGVVGNWRSWGRGPREGRRSGCACSVGGSVLWGLEERLRPEAGAGGGQERGRDSRGCVARIALAGSGR
jgi:hypothetical protein